MFAEAAALLGYLSSEARACTDTDHGLVAPAQRKLSRRALLTDASRFLVPLSSPQVVCLRKRPREAACS